MSSFVEIPQSLYRQITPAGDERTDFYRSDSLIVRWLFWERLRKLEYLMKQVDASGACFDFGGGSGVMLPTLAARFHYVCCVDLDAHLAEEIATKLSLPNVNIEERDVTLFDEYDKLIQYDTVVAADVLEHFFDMSVAVKAIKGRLKPDGMLFTSLPTETLLYGAIRLLIGKKKPMDHYHSAGQVEDFLRKEGFTRILHTSIPAPVIAPLFSISAWRWNGKS